VPSILTLPLPFSSIRFRAFRLSLALTVVLWFAASCVVVSLSFLPSAVRVEATLEVAENLTFFFSFRFFAPRSRVRGVASGGGPPGGRGRGLGVWGRGRRSGIGRHHPKGSGDWVLARPRKDAIGVRDGAQDEEAARVGGIPSAYPFLPHIDRKSSTAADFAPDAAPIGRPASIRAVFWAGSSKPNARQATAWEG
jgi:hypothetical protein